MNQIPLTEKELLEIKKIMERHIGNFNITGPNHMAAMLNEVVIQMVQFQENKTVLEIEAFQKKQKEIKQGLTWKDIKRLSE